MGCTCGNAPAEAPSEQPGSAAPPGR